MKQNLFLLAVLFIFENIFSFSAFSQKVMKISDELKNNSEMLDVKAGGLRANHPYEFGFYKIVSAKTGVMKTKSNSKLFSRYSQSGSTQKSSFVFVGNEVDSVEVNMFNSLKSQSKTERSLSFGNGGTRVEREQVLQQSADSFYAFISPVNDSIDWQLTSIVNYDKESQQLKESIILSDGKTEIEIKEVNESDNGKQSLLWACHGYEFFLDKKSMAAVQTITKQFVWFSKDLDPKMKLILAAAVATMLKRSMP